MSSTQHAPSSTLSNAALSGLIEALSRCADLDQAMTRIDAVLRTAMPGAVVSVNLNATTPDDAANEVQLQRIWTSHPAEYPVTGRKRKQLTHWTDTLFVRGQVVVGEGRAVLVQTFDDHTLMARLGLNAFINVPLLQAGRAIATFNVFGTRPAWREDEVAAVRLLAVLASQWISPLPALVSRFTEVAVRVAQSPIPTLPLLLTADDAA
jgi:GAF domain-containing protein